MPSKKKQHQRKLDTQNDAQLASPSKNQEEHQTIPQQQATPPPPSSDQQQKKKQPEQQQAASKNSKLQATKGENQQQQQLVKKEQQPQEDLNVLNLDPQDSATPDNWIKRSPHLIRLTGPHPLNAEPPSHLLIDSGFITPTPLHYVRNHGSVPKLDWNTHKISFTGLFSKQHKSTSTSNNSSKNDNNNSNNSNEKSEISFTMDELISQFPSIEITVTMACDGNRRKELNLIQHSRGFNWGSGGCSTAKYKGIKLASVLESLNPNLQVAKYVCFEGADDLPKGKYGTSIPLETAMDQTNDVLIAYEMNGKELAPDHGYPCRIVIPGFVGGRNVKWLSKVEISDKESSSKYHYEDNRVLPPSVDIGMADAGNWWHKPEYCLYQLNINSVITHPKHDEWITVQKDEELAKRMDIKGYAHSGGGRGISRVEVSFDEGKNWELCEHEYPENHQVHGFKVWMWCHWKLSVEMWKVIKADTILVRAWDTSYNTQPSDRTWNVLGMMNNSWYSVKVVIHENDHIQLQFIHPTVPGHGTSGHLRQIHPLKPAIKANQYTVDRMQSVYSWEEVLKHNTENNCWIVIDGSVYDVSSYAEHPGGVHSLLLQGGKDATNLFYDIHASDAAEIKERFCIGTVTEVPRVKSKFWLRSSAESQQFALRAERWTKCELIKRDSVSHDTLKLTFRQMSEKSEKLGLPVGQHVLIGADINEHYIVRPYTPIFPISEEEDNGTFELIVKIYRANENKQFPQGGLMSQYLDSLKLRSTVLVKGPAGPIVYHGNGVITIHGYSKKVSTINMIAGGTGITPMYQLIRAIQQDQASGSSNSDNTGDQTRVHLLYANHTTDDILLFNELKRVSEECANVKTWFTVSKLEDKQEWKYSVGRVNESMFRRYLAPPSDDTCVLLCGPPALVEHACIPPLLNIGFAEDQLFEF